MKYVTISRWIMALAAAALSGLAIAQAPVDISFYYPVAVGGPITKIIDKFATDFEKENPGSRFIRSIRAPTRIRSPRRSPPSRATMRRRCRFCCRPTCTR